MVNGLELLAQVNHLTAQQVHKVLMVLLALPEKLVLMELQV
jgi:hypothetical protein